MTLISLLYNSKRIYKYFYTIHFIVQITEQLKLFKKNDILFYSILQETAMGNKMIRHYLLLKTKKHDLKACSVKKIIIYEFFMY